MANSASQNKPTPMTKAIVGVLIVVACVAFAARLVPGPRTIDDAFITFRYSRNIVEGHGFVYNPGSRTLGTTTPLYTLLMAAAGLITGSEAYPWFALVINALADAGSSVLLALLMVRLTGYLPVAALVGIAWAINPVSVTFAIGGMETSVAILWQVAAVYAYVSRYERWMVFFAALGILTRIDTVIWAGLLLLHQLVTRWNDRRHDASNRWFDRLPWQSWTVGAAVVTPWYVFSLAYFGTLLPRSLSAKRLVYVVDDLQAVIRLLQHVATPFFDHKTLGIPGIAMGLALYPALAAIGTLYAVYRKPRLLPFLVYPWLYFAIFSIMNPLIFRWYLAPMLPAYLLAIILGVWVVAHALSEALGWFSLRHGVVGGVAAIVVVFLLNAWVLHPDHGRDRPAPAMAWHKIELNYRKMAEALRVDFGISDETLVAAGDIGAVGFYSRARILDTVGLVTPEVSAYYPLDRTLLVDGANYAVPPQIILDYRPDYIILMEDSVHNGLARESQFEALYARVRFIPTEYYGEGMLLYQRRDLARTGS